MSYQVAVDDGTELFGHDFLITVEIQSIETTSEQDYKDVITDIVNGAFLDSKLTGPVIVRYVYENNYMRPVTYP